MAVAAAFGAAASAAQASLSVPTGGPPVTFTSLSAFEAAAGGADNGTLVGEQGGGFRHVNWDAIRLDGSDPGSAVINPGVLVAPAPGRLQPWGLSLGPNVAVSSDGFHSVNSSVRFTPFTPPNSWAPFNSNVAEFDVVAPDAQGSTPVPAQSRGLGVLFLDVRLADSTEIQYFNGDIPLGQVFAPVNPGGPSFAGLLFPNPVVTRVAVTLGTGRIFDFNGSVASPGPSTADPVAGDDVALAEPAPARAPLKATAGVPVTAVLDTFTESTSGSSVSAVIDWGDGVRTPGTIAPAAGGAFAVTGNHAYAAAGSHTAKVTVQDFQGPQQISQTDISVGPRPTTMSVTCSPSPVAVTAATTCTVAVSDAAAGERSAPTGLVSFTSPTPGAAFPRADSCLLGSSATSGESVCAVRFTPGQLPPDQARVLAAYSGDGLHTASNGIATIGVSAQRCRVQTLSRRLRPAGLGVLVTCDARASVQITAKALAARKGTFRAFQLQFGTLRAAVTAGRPTVLVIKPASGVLRALRTALRRHQHVSFKLTLTASSHATQRTTTTRVAAIRLS